MFLVAWIVLLMDAIWALLFFSGYRGLWALVPSVTAVTSSFIWFFVVDPLWEDDDAKIQA